MMKPLLSYFHFFNPRDSAHWWILGLFTFIGVIFFKPDFVIDEAIAQLSPEVSYKVIHEKIDKGGFKPLREGLLGKFADCLVEYRSGFKAKVKAPDGISEYIHIKVNKNFVFRLSLSLDEVYSFSVEKIDEEGGFDGASKPYAVNCDLRLLNQFD